MFQLGLGLSCKAATFSLTEMCHAFPKKFFIFMFNKPFHYIIKLFAKLQKMYYQTKPLSIIMLYVESSGKCKIS